ncbi:TetR/AcrR family transcriptional regulator [Plantactinospora mayteni]|uniref:TetR family transcriptional regulator n=1 Tax=Plantactinospora mayteni TaxID=566021 RepID=A0ABQ4EM95_9ACTN|nr:TetR family transcriptional regulator [Plantactinospora mayteni]
MAEVPRLANHEQRRAQIVDALLRIAATRGLHAASMRTVAAEAGVTVSTVQYYFHSKEQLLFAGLRHLAEALGRRRAEAVTRAARTGADDAVPVRDLLDGWLGQLIPADDEQRAAYTVFAAYHALALTDPALAALPYARNSGDLERAIADRLDRAGRAGELAPGRNPEAEAGNLLALATGLADSVMAGLRSASAARALLGYHLDQIFATRPAQHG